MNYVFDVDGTLTPSSKEIDKKFEEFFLDFATKNDVTIVGGSTYDMIKEQLGEDICNRVDSVFACQGTQQYKNGEVQFKEEVEWPSHLNEVLRTFLVQSSWNYKYSSNINNRDSMINFSVVGRDCPPEKRTEYNLWDNQIGERHYIANYINKYFPTLECTIGGEISVDITPKGVGKHKILDHIEGDITFFGDKCDEGGNDYSLAEKLKESDQTVYQVTDWEDTQRRLKEL